jgi:murein DD-endopeptidase MepM/ murein hydrolase activator NlpD
MRAAVGAWFARLRAGTAPLDATQAFEPDHSPDDHVDAECAAYKPSLKELVDKFPGLDLDQAFADELADPRSTPHGLDYRWLFDVVGVYCYDSYYRPGYIKDAGNPQGWHRAQDFSKYRSFGVWRSLAGQKVRVPLAGTVAKEGWDPYWGWFVRVNCVDGNAWLFAHLRSRSPLRRGMSIGERHFVGYVGQSGNATGPHLHLERWKGHDSDREPRYDTYAVYDPHYPQAA